MKKPNVTFVIGGKQTSKVKKIMQKWPKDGAITDVFYIMKSGTGKTMDVTLHIYWN